MSAINRKDRVRVVWPSSDLDGHTGRVRRTIRTRKADGTHLSRYVVALDKADSRGAKTAHVFEDRIEPINGGAR